jgi:hypothetical protein
MKGSSPPKPPNPAKLIEQQGQAILDAANTQQLYNSTNQVTPTGGVSFVQGPDGQWTATTALSPAQAANLAGHEQFGTLARGTALQQLGAAASALSQPLDLSNANIGSEITAKLGPQFQAERERQRQALDATLANKGIFQGSAAYTNALRDFDANQNDAWNRLTTDARGQVIGEMVQARNQPLTETAALLGQSPILWPNQNFVDTPQVNVAPVDAAGITNQGYQNQLARAQLQEQSRQANLNALLSLGGLGVKAYTG